MRPLGWLLVGSALASGGCLTLTADAARNLWHEKAIEAGSAKARLYGRREARRAWTVIAGPRTAYSAAYEDGFLDGYTDYVVNGGPGNPPALPPPGYRKQGRACPEEAHAPAEWFAGFRHGTDTARADNARCYRLVPVLVSAGPAEAEPPGGAEVLPPPRTDWAPR